MKSFPSHTAETYLAIEIGGTKLQLVLGDAAGNIIRRWRHSVDKSKGGAGIREQITTTLQEILPTTQLSGVGVGFGGPVNWRTGKIARSHQIEGWSEFELGEWLHSLIGQQSRNLTRAAPVPGAAAPIQAPRSILSQPPHHDALRTGRPRSETFSQSSDELGDSVTAVPIRVDNDANVGALGEALHGAGVGFNPVFYVTLGSGVGGGLVVDGRIYHGAQPGEAEIGHIRLDKHGTIVESRCSGWAVDRRIREFIAKEPRSLLARLVGDTRGGEAKHLNAALAQHDAEAKRILSETVDDLAFGLSHVVHLFHPQMIVLGGGLSLLGEPLRAAVAEALPRYVMQVFQPGPQIRLAKLGEDAVPVGALALARSVVSSPNEIR